MNKSGKAKEKQIASQEKVIIFDFDGTIADSMALVSEIGNKLLPLYGREQGITAEDIQALRSMTIPQALKYMNVPAYRLPKVALHAKQELSARIDKLEPVPGMISVIKQLHERGYELGIVTSNSADNVTKFLRKHNLKSLFSFVDTGVSLFGKARHIKQTLKRQRLIAQDCIYIGDEIRDIEAARALNMPCVSVTWGFNDPGVLKENDPDEIVTKPSELEMAISKISK